MTIGHLYVLFRQMSVQVFGTFFEWVVCFDTIKHHKLFENFGVDKSLNSYIICNCFLPTVGCLFILLIVSFVAQKLLSLRRSHLLILALISIILGGGLKKMF